MTDTLIPRSDDDVAISVENVSKSYGLWQSSGARLKFPMLNIAKRILPSSFSLRSRIEKTTAGMFHEFRALQDVSFQVRKKESWGIIGVNGSGKSTLLKIISGNLRPSAGRVEVDGKVSILDYTSGLHPDFTGRENVYMKGAILGMSRRQVEDRFAPIEAFADIGEFMDQPVKTYSSGMTARLGFAIMAHVDADIIITDEALAVGDAFFVQKCMDFIRGFLERGTFIFVSHSTHDVVSLCQKAIWLDGGRMRAIGPAGKVADAYLSSRSMELSRQYLQRSGAEGSVPQPSEPVTESEDVNGVSLGQPQLSERMNAKAPRIIKDPRLEFLNRSPWRNDIKIPEFAISAEGYGVGGAKVEEAYFLDDTGASLSWVIGGELVRLQIVVRAERNIETPIVGFQVRNRLGQGLFGDNTYLVTAEKPFSVAAGQRFAAEFSFQMPMLPVGEYVIRVAAATGSNETENAMLHCVDDGIAFQSVASWSRHGLIGIPMHEVKLQVLDR